MRHIHYILHIDGKGIRIESFKVDRRLQLWHLGQKIVDKKVDKN
jgi:hypothetical protein